MKWHDMFDVFVLCLLFGSVILHANRVITDWMITLIAAPSMLYIMVVSDMIRKKSRRYYLRRKQKPPAS
ncbi:hypothetical protein ACFFGV_00980 [Pontibacillus salicampi]|uniref:Uncharacterized protein n=1 Tax=Pontibacillus salicampi TaxID=1449801 RepID=A0ABV6LIE8_9BACI